MDRATRAAPGRMFASERERSIDSDHDRCSCRELTAPGPCRSSMRLMHAQTAAENERTTGGPPRDRHAIVPLDTRVDARRATRRGPEQHPVMCASCCPGTA